MSTDGQHEVTSILQRLRDDGREQRELIDRLYELLYKQLHDRAGLLLFRERDGHTLSPTALVHEVYLKLSAHPSIDWDGRAHFLGVSARAMRQVLVDYAKQRAAKKRGGDWLRVSLSDEIADSPRDGFDILVLHDRLEELSKKDARMAQVVELRFFGDMTEEQIARILGVSRRTVAGDWRVAKKWLRRELDGGDR